jgi:hypothetical protein
MSAETATIPEAHSWTNGANRVLLVKSLNRDGTSGNKKDFVYPKSGPVNPVVADNGGRDATCESGGLFGWPWGMFVGDGRDPDACAPWVVLSALPQNVIALDGGKCKAVTGVDGSDAAEVVYYGDMAGAMYFTSQGRVALVLARSSGSASATGDSGSASATGDSGSASATGYSGSASATGKDSWAIGGLNGSAMSGADDGMIEVFYRDQSGRRRVAVGYVGENGIEKNVWYRVVGNKLTATTKN